MLSRGGWIAAAVCALSVLAADAEARTRALVVGVSGYPALAKSLRLTGPKNDSREVANSLARLGVAIADITVLADGVAGLTDGIALNGPGTKAAILGELEELAAGSAAGDLVVFYFSGHGSQQPDRDGDEGGAADEIFLPYDVGKWTGAGVENALVDDELSVPIQQMLDKGVDFFGIIDACHSATGFRAVADDEVKARVIDPAELGIPDSPAGQVSPGRLELEQSRSLQTRGRAAFFYAAQEDEEALERTPSGGDPGEFFGVFTYNLLKRLNQSPDITYRTLHQAVGNDIKRGSLMSTQTPELEGELLDEPVLRLTKAAPRRQWPIFAGKLQAGQLEGLDAGTVVALYDDPAASDDAPVAHGVVENAGATKSIVAPRVYPCEQTNADGTCPVVADPAAFKKGRFVRIVEPGIDFSVTLSEPLRINADDGHDYGPALAALQAALSSETLATRVRVAPAGYDVAVGLVGGKLAFAAAGGSIDRDGPGSSPRLTLPDNPAAAAAHVSAAISRIARALALQRLGGSDSGAALGLKTEIRIAKDRPGTAVDGACPNDEADYEAPTLAGAQPQLDACDILSVDFVNGGKKPLDVTILLIGGDFSITPVWPEAGEANRILAGDRRSIDLLQMEADPEAVGEERLVMVAVPGVSRSHTAFDNLEQEGLRAVPGEPPEIEAARELIAVGLNDMQRSATSVKPRVEEEMAVEIRPFSVRKAQ